MTAKKPRKGVVDAWDYSDILPDTIQSELRNRDLGEGKKIEVRFRGRTPKGVAILHTTKYKFVFPFDAEYLSESDIEENFYRELPEEISDSLPGGLLSVYVTLTSDISNEELVEDYGFSRGELSEIRKKYDDYTLDILL
ncbi:MAG: hypothetical protein QXO44_03245 [Thermoplasmatales archaeon]